MYILLAVAFAMAQLPSREIDIVSVVSVALERVMPTAQTATSPRPILPLGQRTLILDVARTTESFRSVSSETAPDYRQLNRPFVARSYADAVRCDPVMKQQCRFADDEVYATITSVKPDSATGGYVIKLLVYWSSGVRTGPMGFAGLEQEMFVSTNARAEWKVDRLGIARAIN